MKFIEIKVVFRTTKNEAVKVQTLKNKAIKINQNKGLMGIKFST